MNATATRQTRPTRRLPAARGFTLVELMISIALVALLIGLLLPVLASVNRQRNRTNVSATLASISTALDAYNQDFGDYPRFGVNPATPTVTNPFDPLNVAPDRGARLLARALFGVAPIDDSLNPPAATSTDPKFRFEDGHGDVSNPFGFKEERQTVTRGTAQAFVYPGPVRGPYLDATRFRLRQTTDANLLSDGYTYGPDAVILDPLNDQPILYYPARARALELSRDDDGSAANGGNFLSANLATQRPLSLYNAVENPGSLDTDPVPLLPGLSWRDPAPTAVPNRAYLAEILGDINQDGMIGPGETATTTGKFLLITGGLDGFQYDSDSASPRYRTWSVNEPIANFPVPDLK